MMIEWIYLKIICYTKTRKEKRKKGKRFYKILTRKLWVSHQYVGTYIKMAS